jgi:hypothetical protein
MVENKLNSTYYIPILIGKVKSQREYKSLLNDKTSLTGKQFHTKKLKLTRVLGKDFLS